MAINRRGILGAIGGAAITGPGAAKAMIDTRSSSVAADLNFAARRANKDVLGGPGDTHRKYFLTKIERARRFLSGDLTEEEKLDVKRKVYDRQRLALEGRVEALRSVSKNAKVGIYLRELAAIDTAVERLVQEQSLIVWLKELGE